MMPPVVCGATRSGSLLPFAKLAKVQLDRRVLMRQVTGSILERKSQAEKDEMFDAELERALLNALLGCEAAANASVQEDVTCSRPRSNPRTLMRLRSSGY